jgi:hypothetical protein
MELAVRNIACAAPIVQIAVFDDRMRASQAWRVESES